MKGSHAAREVSGESLEVECTHCGIPMTERAGAEGQIQYFYCPSCRRSISSVYSEVFRVDAKVRIQRRNASAPSAEGFEAVKGRLEQWLADLDSQDPYRMMGVSPRDSLDRIRNRYRQLALERHPDRGGSAEGMKELNLAYGRVTRHREGMPSRSPAPVAAASTVLPPKRK